MQKTLVEVLGEERGKTMYSMAWLVERVRFHIDSDRCRGEVFIAETEGARKFAGHTIVRIELEDGQPFGLFSTFYVVPEFRRRLVATALIQRGEEWMKDRGLERAATDTSLTNDRLIQLCKKQGYKKIFQNAEMLRLSKNFDRVNLI